MKYRKIIVFSTQNIFSKLNSELQKKEILLIVIALFSAIFLILIPPLYIFGAILGILLAIIAFRFPKLVIYFLAFYMPLEEFIEKWLPSGMIYEGVRYSGEVFILISFISVLIHQLILKRKWRSTPIDLPLIGLFIVVLISATINFVPLNYVYLGVRPFLRYIPIFIILVQLGIDEKSTERFLRWVYILGIFISAIALFQAIIGLPATYFLSPKDVIVSGDLVREGFRQLIGVHTRVFSTLGRYDTLGTYLCILLLVSFGYYSYSGNSTKKFIRTFWVFAIPALLFSYSRQSWLALIIGILVILYISNRKKFAFGISLSIVILLFLLIISFPTLVRYSSSIPNVSIINRLLEPFSREYYEISRYKYGRLFVITEVSSRILEHAPFFGFGPARFGSLTTRYLGFDFASLIDLNPDSAFLVNDVNWVILLGQIGTLGTIFFILMLFFLSIHVYKIFKSSRSDLLKGLALGYFGAIIAFAILGFFGPNFEIRQISYYFWLFGGIILGINKIG